MFIKGISNVNKETIEKKRQEALAKLELKKKQGTQECKYKLMGVILFQDQF